MSKVDARLRTMLIAMAAAGSLVGSGCLSSGDSNGKGGKPSGPLAEGATFTYAISDDPGNLDPATNFNQTGITAFRFAYDTMVGLDKDGTVLPGLASKWEVTPKRVTFTLREGVTCADGSPVTPSVVAENFEYLKDPKVQNAALGTLDYTAKGDDAAGTVTIDFEQPIGFPLQSMILIPIVCGDGLEDRKSLVRGTSGTGPYTLTEAVPNDHYTFTLRRGYKWGPGKETSDTPGLPAKVVLKVIPNTTTVANLLLNGQIDGGLVGGAETERLRGAGIGSLPLGAGSLQMYFNEAEGHPTADPALRRAMTMAVNRDDVAKVGGGPVANNLAMIAVNPCGDLDMDKLPQGGVEAAGAELDSAGWKKGSDGIRTKDGQRLEVTSLEMEVGDPGRNAAAALIRKAWSDLGIDVETRSLGPDAVTEALEQGTWDVAPVLSIDVLVPSQLAQFLSGPAPPDGLNQGHVNNADYDRLAAEALAAPEDEACDLWNQAEEALLARADVVPLYRTETLGWHSKKSEFKYDGVDIVPTSIRMYGGS